MRYFFSMILIMMAWKALSAWLCLEMLPPPEAVWSAFGAAVKSEVFWYHFGASGFRAATAMAGAWAVGFPLGMVAGYDRRMDRILSPIVFLTYPIPKIVLLPVFLVVFGLGDFARIFVIGLIVGYQVFVTTRDSVHHLPRPYEISIRSLGGKTMDILRHVLIPATLPDGFTALRIAVGTAIAVLFFVESFATETGLGYLIMDAWGRFDGKSMFVAMLGMSLLGVVLYETINYMERMLCSWKRKEAMERLTRPSRIASSLRTYARMIKISHTVFAFPFALASLVLVGRTQPIRYEQVFWILVAVVAARSAAMGFNRKVDADYDALNPRTRSRELPSGRIHPRSAVIFVVVSSLVFVTASGMLSRLCLFLSLPVLGLLFFYSYTKRFTAYSHLYLGLGISLSPLGAWIAVTGQIDWRILVLCLALLSYIAGFDILYACQDMEFDRKIGLYSIPAKWGAKAAFRYSGMLHVVTGLALIALHDLFDLGAPYLFSVLIIACLLVVEHRLVHPDDLSRIDIAFFHVNGVISVLLFLGILGSEMTRSFA